MNKIDLKDRKILYQLDLNCRRSNSQIGKKVGLKRDIVGYRIKRLQEIGIIKGFWTAIDTFKLGYDVFRIYITFQYVNQEIKNNIIHHFNEYKNTWAVVSIQGEIDLSVAIWVKDIYEFYMFWEKTLDLYEDYFAEAIVSVYIQAVSYKKSIFLPDRRDRSGREMYNTTCGNDSVEIDNVDYKLLNEIANNARMPMIKLAEKLGCSSQNATYRLKQLIDKNIIKAFRVNVDLSKLGLQIFKVNIYLKEHKKKQEIIHYLRNTPFLECLNVAVGWSDIEPELIVENVQKLQEIMENVNQKFPNAIKKQNFTITEKVHKERWLPEI
jgi:Lrp/AsnC family leucine-responsive transcriptional regulator